jgi:hypothetical protein
MGFMQGFFTRAGERAHEQNLLDIQQKIEKHKAFMEHLQKIADDPTFLPEAQQAARQRWLEATQAGPMKFKNYDLSDILTVNTTSRAKPSGQQFTYPGPPQEEGGPSDYSNTFTRSAISLVPGERGVAGARSGRYTPEELAEMEADANALKQRRLYEEVFKYQKALKEAGKSRKKVESRAMTGSALRSLGVGATTEGYEIPENDLQHYQVVRFDDGTTEIYGPIAPTYSSGPIAIDPATGQPVQTVRNPQTGAYQPAQMGGLLPQIPGIHWVTQKDAQGNFYDVATDPYTNKVHAWIKKVPTVQQSGTITTREQFVDKGGELERQEFDTIRRPANILPSFDPAAYGLNPPETLPPGLMPVTGGYQPAPTPQPQQPSTPQPTPSSAPIAQPTPPPPTINKGVVKRSSAEQLDQYMGLDKEPVTDTTPINSKNVGASLRTDFNPRRPSKEAVPVVSGGVNKRKNVIKKTTRPLTRYQRDRLYESEATLRQTLERAYGVLQRSDMLDNMLTAGKLEIAINPSRPYQLITRIVGNLSPAEAQLAADFTSLKEDIQKMRTPMGGAGFRSLEAFMALQAQRGSMLGSPAITKAVLRNSIKVFLSLRGVAQNTLAEDIGETSVADDLTILMYLDAYGNEADGSRAMRLDGYK